MQLKDRVAVVTGGAHRVGKAIGLALAGAGAHVVVHYHRSAAEAPRTVAEIEALGARAVAVGADLATAEGVEALFEAVEQEFGRLDVLVNSAAMMEPGDVLTLSRAEWQRSLDLNLSAPFFCAQCAARLMLATATAETAAAIVNVADLSGLHPWARYPAHSVSKAGLIMLTQVLAKALAPRIRVNAIAPGPVIKPPEWNEARWQAVGEHTLLKRSGTGYDVARGAVYLLESDYVTGETLVIDGGRLIA